MNRSFPIALGMMLSTVAFAGEGVRLTREELFEFLPGAKVVHVAKSTGSTRRWTNDPDGKLVAHSNNKMYGSIAGNKAASAPGTWSVSDDGKYCIAIEWGRVAENWCAAIVKDEAGAYYLNSVDPERKIEFTK
ncbi:MAG: DUF995 domain-containing protein [Azonexus sp.]